jgi:hypothetical protein
VLVEVAGLARRVVKISESLKIVELADQAFHRLPKKASDKWREQKGGCASSTPSNLDKQTEPVEKEHE